MAPIWSYQPFKALLTTLIFAGSPLYFSILAIYYLPSYLRPDPNWSWGTALGRDFYTLLFKYSAWVRLAPDYTEKANTPKDRYTLAQPLSKEAYTDVLDHPTIKPIPVGGMWFPSAPKPNDLQTKNFVMHFPGGAYVIAFAAKNTGIFPSSVFSGQMDAFTLYSQYRVAAKPQTRFPAAIQDAITFYMHLIDLGVPAKKIIVSGDSAGGNLVIALLRYIGKRSDRFPWPGAAIVWSPWVNVTDEGVSSYKTSESNSTDVVPNAIIQWGLEAYLPPKSESSDETSLYISPLHHPFSSGIPLFIHAGTAEVFLEDIRSFAQEMAGIEGNSVQLYESPRAPHDLILCGKLLGMAGETEKVARECRKFFNF